MKITLKKALAAAEKAARGLTSPGFCIKCGKAHKGIDPDARKCLCTKCGARAVYGAEELVLMLA